jgi:6-phosphogluconolactonase
MPGTTLLAQDEASFYTKAAALFLETVAGADPKNLRTVALSGGSTPKKLFAKLAEPYYRERVSWNHLHFFWVDERCVPPDHDDSNFKSARDLLLSKVHVPEVNIHRMAGEMESAQQAAKAYEQMLQAHFRYERPFPKFDFMLLGVGDDGHTASLFPGTDALEEKEKWVVGHFVPKANANRITLTFPVINNARRILFLVGGESKASIVKEIYREESSGHRFPAERVKAEWGELIWLLDPAAASKLPATTRHKATHI